MKSKRLFIFAAFDPTVLTRDINTNQIDESQIVYIKSLAKMGDVVFYISNDVSEAELDKVRPYTLYAGGHQHYQYDFGSYKYAYLWARDNLDLSAYTHIYMVNDSMYAPLHPILPILEELESKNTDATGIAYNPHKKHPHIQSWFFGMTKKVFLTDWFDSFMTGITKQKDKGLITKLYEQGFTKLLIDNNISFTYKYTFKGHGVYNDIKKTFKQGFPFMKKASFGRKHGSLGRQVLYVLNHVSPDVSKAIIEDAQYVYGKKYVENFLTNNILRITYRKIKHGLYKLFVEGV